MSRGVETMKNSSLKSLVFATVIVIFLAVVGLLWFYFPRNDKRSGMEVIDGKFVFKELGLVFVYNPDVLDWANAHKACRQRQGHLAVPHSFAEAKAMVEVMKNNSVKVVHAGFHDLFLEKEYVTVNGESLKEVGYQARMFKSMQGPEFNCGKMASNSLVSTKCSEMLTSICRLSMWHDYDLLAGHGYYKLHVDATTWPTAWSTCRMEGSSLLVLRSQAELNAMTLMMMANNATITSDYLVLHYGAYSLLSGDFTTIFDEPLESSGYNSWANWTVASQSESENLSFAALHLRPSAPAAQAAGLSTTRRPDAALPFICKHDLYR